MATMLAPVAGYQLEIAADLSDKKVRERLSPTAAKGFFRVADAWKLKDSESALLLGGISNGKLYNLKNGEAKAALDQDELTRISLILGVFKALRILYSRQLADVWVKLPNRNPIFAGRTPLEYMTRGGMLGIQLVRQLLDARRGG